MRDLTELSLPENLLENARVDRQIGTRADPRLRLLSIASLLKLGQDALDAAVLLEHLKRDRQQRILGLRIRAAQHAPGGIAELAAHRTARVAAQHTAQDRVEKSHGLTSLDDRATKFTPCGEN